MSASSASEVKDTPKWDGPMRAFKNDATYYVPLGLKFV